MPRSTNSVYQVIWRGTLHGQIVATSLHFRTVASDGSDFDATRMSEFLAAAHAWWITNAIPKLNVDYTYFATGITEIAGVTVTGSMPEWSTVTLNYGAAVVNTSNIGTAGGEAGNPLPNQTAMIVNSLTGLAGRRNRGRMKIGGLNESDNNDAGLLEEVTRAAWQTPLTTLATDGFTSTTPTPYQFVPVVFSKRKIFFSSPIASMRTYSERVTALTVNINWGQQRSRRQDLGAGA
jgi:hypothetical protein